MQFKVFEEGIEVNGNTVNSIMKGFGITASLAKSHFRTAGLPETIMDGEWYSQEKWLKAFESISLTYGDNVMFEIGLKIPESAIFPPSVKDVESAIQSIDVAYHMNHRKNGVVMFDEKTGTMLEGIGHYGYKKVPGDNLIVSECANPYPHGFDLGIITFMARKFAPNATVVHDDSKPCRKNGAESCTYIVSWK